ncbi:MAG: histidine kinase [Chitinophagaceae bacterium]
MKRFQRPLMALFQSRGIMHLIFCFVFINLFFLPVISNNRPYQIIDRAVVVCLFLLFVTYCGRWCCRKWLLKMKLFPFVISILVMVIVCALMVGLYLDLAGLQHGYEVLFVALPLVILFLALGVFLTLSKEALRRQLVDLEISDQQKQSELDLLKAQLSPHFLFNTLNNLYGVALNKPDKIAPLLVKLSNLLRYSVYETKERFVPLNDELAYIWNYIELEKMRMADRLSLKMNIEQHISSAVRVSPMVLIVFVENAFKHAKNTLDDAIHIEISLTLAEGKIYFAISNNCDYDKWLEQQVEKERGIGIATTVRRLDLLYPNEYKLGYRMDKNIYYLNLELKIK